MCAAILLEVHVVRVERQLLPVPAMVAVADVVVPARPICREFADILATEYDIILSFPMADGSSKRVVEPGTAEEWKSDPLCFFTLTFVY